MREALAARGREVLVFCQSGVGVFDAPSTSIPPSCLARSH